MSVIRATFQDGVFKPTSPVPLPEHCEVEIELRVSGDSPGTNLLEQELNWLTSRSPAEIEIARERVLKASRPARPLPEGKTLADVVEGQWPGDETDEQVSQALERLS